MIQCLIVLVFPILFWYYALTIRFSVFFPPFSDFSLLPLSCPFFLLTPPGPHPLVSVVFVLLHVMSVRSIFLRDATLHSSPVSSPVSPPRGSFSNVRVFPDLHFASAPNWLLFTYGFPQYLGLVVSYHLTTKARLLFPPQSCLPCVVCIWVLALFNGLS